MSGQQTLILECLWRSRSKIFPDHLCHVSIVSWYVAEKLNRGHGDRIWDDEEHKMRLIEEFREELRELTDDEGNFLSEEAAKEACRRREAIIFKLIDGCHRQSRRLTEKHRASFHRAIKRLEARGLIERIVDLRSEEVDGEPRWVAYTGDGRTRYIALTQEGIKAARALFG